MSNGKVLALYMTMPDMMRSGHRMRVEDFECDGDGIVGDIFYDNEFLMLLTSQKSYEIIEEAELYVDQGVLMESIHIDMDINHLKKGSILEIGETYFEVQGPCESYDYLYNLAPELPELLHGNRGIFVTPVEYGKISLGDSVSVVKEV